MIVKKTLKHSFKFLAEKFELEATVPRRRLDFKSSFEKSLIQFKNTFLHPIKN